MISIRHSLTLRIAGVVTLQVCILGVSLYFIVLTAVSDFVEDEVERDLRALSRRAYSICNIAFEDILQSGLVADRESLIIRQALTLGQIEDFFREQSLKGLIYNAGDNKLLLVSDLPMEPALIMAAKAPPGKMTSLGSHAAGHFAYHFEFSPWNWHLTIVKSEKAYANLTAKVQRVHYYTFALLALAAFVSGIFFYQSVKRPIDAIIEPIKSGQRPCYEGIDVFAFLTNTITEMMDSLQQSQEKYRCLVESTSDFVWEVDQNGAYTYASPAIGTILGYAPEEVIGEMVFKFMVTSKGINTKSAIRYIVTSRVPFERLEHVQRHKNGRRVVMETSGVPILNTAGDLLGYRGISRDITDRKRAQDRLKASQERLRNILNASPMGIHLYEIQDGNRLVFLGANPSADRLLGIQHEIFIGKTIEAAFPEIGDTEIPHRYREAALFGTTWHSEQTIPNTEAANGIFEVVAFQTEPGKMASFFNDITTRKKREKELQRTRALLETAIKQSPSGILIADAPNVRIRLANSAAFSIRGGEHDQLTEMELPLHATRWNTFYPDGHPYPSQEHPLSKAVLKGEVSRDVEVIIIHESGEKRWVTVNAAPISDKEGNIIAGIAVFDDITDRVKAEMALRESEEKFRTLFEESPLAISIIDKGGQYQNTNPQFHDMFGYTTAEVSSGSEWFRKAFPDPSYRQQAKSIWIEDQQQIQTGQAKPRVFTVTCKDGTQKEIHFRPVIMKSMDQFVIYEDITEKRKMAERMQQAQKMEAIGTLAGGVAHDFNNLLMGIQGRASLMASSLDSAHSHAEHIQAIEEYIRSATVLTKQLLGLARGGKYEVRPIDLHELVMNSAAMFGRTKKEIQIRKRLSVFKLIVEADKRQMEQVLLNIYVNAWQAMPEGGSLYLASNRVTLDEVYCEPHRVKPGNYARISITDTGIGMDKSILQRIFDPFFTTKETGRGTGLGLASAYGIIKNHGGMITVYSELGHGSTFNLYLPLSDKKLRKESAIRRELAKGSETLLLVDDEEMVIEVGQAMLKRLGYQVIIAKSGEQAIETVRRMTNKIDLVILDMIMPGIDGGSTFDRIRRICPSLPVILSSGYALNDEAEAIMHKGCNGFIQKPYSILDLSLNVRRIIDESRKDIPPKT